MYILNKKKEREGGMKRKVEAGKERDPY